MSIKLKEGMAVEHVSVPGEKIVKMLHGKDVVAMDEDGNLDIYRAADLYPIPGDDYRELGEIIHHAVESIREQVSENFGRHDARLSLTRHLYDEGLRVVRPDASRQDIRLTIKPEEVSAVLAEQIKLALAEYRTEVEHFTPEGTETLVPLPTAEELARMACEVAETLWMTFGHPPINLRDDLRHDLGLWINTESGNAGLRRRQVWQIAINLVSNCHPRIAGMESTIDGYYRNFLLVTEPATEEPECAEQEQATCAAQPEEVGPAETTAPRGKPVIPRNA